MKVVPAFCYQQKNGAQNDVANVGEEVIEVTEIHHQSIRMCACKIVVAEVLIPSFHHHLVSTNFKQFETTYWTA